MRGVTFYLPLPAKGGGRGEGSSRLVITSYGVTHPNPSLGREGLL